MWTCISGGTLQRISQRQQARSFSESIFRMMTWVSRWWILLKCRRIYRWRFSSLRSMILLVNSVQRETSTPTQLAIKHLIPQKSKKQQTSIYFTLKASIMFTHHGILTQEQSPCLLRTWQMIWRKVFITGLRSMGWSMEISGMEIICRFK